MKQLISILLLLITSFQLMAQDKLTDELEQALQFTLKSREHANKAAEELGFYEGSADLEEIKYHLYESRIAMDSLLTNVQKAGYKGTDAFYSAKDLNLKGIQQNTQSIKQQLKETAADIKQVMKEIDLVFTNTPYNLGTYLYQTFQKFNHVQEQLQQVERDLKTTLKANQKKLP